MLEVVQLWEIRLHPQPIGFRLVMLLKPWRDLGRNLGNPSSREVGQLDQDLIALSVDQVINKVPEIHHVRNVLYCRLQIPPREKHNLKRRYLCLRL